MGRLLFSSFTQQRTRVIYTLGKMYAEAAGGREKSERMHVDRGFGKKRRPFRGRRAKLMGKSKNNDEKGRTVEHNGGENPKRRPTPKKTADGPRRKSTTTTTPNPMTLWKQNRAAPVNPTPPLHSLGQQHDV